MLTTEKINEILGIKDSYEAPQKLMSVVLDDSKLEKTTNEFLKHEKDLNYEWFQQYFEDEHSDRKNKKQDFTPQSVSYLLEKLVGKSNSYFESAAGTGGIMIQSWRENKENVDRFYCVEELSNRAIPFLLFNMAIRKINGFVFHGDSLEKDFEAVYQVLNGKVRKLDDYYHGSRLYSSVLMNPPFSAKWSGNKKFEEDKRFISYKKIAPKSKADFAFLLHGFSKLDTEGTMAIVLPHGVLFRGGAEGTIRQELLEEGNIYAVIGLPANLFYGTSIPTTIIVLKKRREPKDVLFIDASKDFEKMKNQNKLKDEHIAKIIDTYEKREDVEKYAHVAPYSEIEENDHNLNISRFVDTFEEEEPVDVKALHKEIKELNQEIEEVEAELLGMLNELAVNDDETQELLEATREVFK
jgi:type I restriction enzyme M protein